MDAEDKHLRRRSPLQALQHHNYRIFFFGQLISLVGTWIQNVAQSWLVYRLTGSSLELGLVGFLSQIPILVLGPIAGAFADRFPRRRILLITQTASMLLAALLAILSLGEWVTIWQVRVLAVLLGSANAFDAPARHSFVVEMVGREDLPNAIALNSSLFNGARMVGPAIAAVLVLAVGEGLCFLINATSYLGVIYGLASMRLGPQAVRPQTGSRLAHLLEGFRMAWRTPSLRVLFSLMAVASIFGAPYVVLMPLFSDRILHIGPTGLGLLMACSGSGAFLGALVLAARPATGGLARWVPLACAGFGLSLVAFSLSRTYWLSGALLVLAGFSLMVQIASSTTLVHALVPDELRGRVMAIHTMMFLGVAPLGALLAGAAAARFGAPTAVAVGGTVCVTGAIALFARLPRSE